MSTTPVTITLRADDWAFIVGSLISASTHDRYEANFADDEHARELRKDANTGSRLWRLIHSEIESKV